MLFTSSPPSDAYMHRIGSVLVQIMVCRLFADKPSSESVLGYCQLDLCILIKTSSKFVPLGTNLDEILIKIQNMYLKISSVIWRPFWPGEDELMHWALQRMTEIVLQHLQCILLKQKIDLYFDSNFSSIPSYWSLWGRVMHICISKLGHHWFKVSTFSTT